MTKPEMNWNAALYDEKHAFVYKYGEALLDLLAPQLGERILDLGCGTGHLTSKIRDSGADVVGIDASPTMVDQARTAFPDIQFLEADGRDFQLDGQFDAVFSNATLHWISPPLLPAQRMYHHLKKGGRMVAEFGGKNNNQLFLNALRDSFRQFGFEQNAHIDFWYFPSIGEYTSLLEQVGFQVSYASHFERPTPLEGEEGAKNWFRMFGSKFFQNIPHKEQEAILEKAEALLRPSCYRHGKWVADYRRIRVVAIKP